MIWRDIPSLPGYQASDDGSVKRLACLFQGRRFKERILKPTNDGGYLVVRVVTGGTPRHQNARINRLVCEAFNGPHPVGKPFALHNDGNSLNNSPSNLRWGFGAENAADRNTHGRTARGERNSKARLTAEIVRSIRASPLTQMELAAIYGVSQTTISSVILNNTWKHVE